MKATFKCIECGESKPVHTDGGTGYAEREDGTKVCYACCGVVDAAYMNQEGRITLYDTGTELTNWPGTLRFRVQARREGRHNFAGKSYRVYFFVNGTEWTGVRYGDNTQLIHCKRLKTKGGAK